jgi:hypothetical protein
MRIFAIPTVLLFFYSFCEAGSTLSRPEPASALSDLLSVETAGSALSSASPTGTETGRAMVTSPPELGKGGSIQLQEKWHLTTYWSCDVFDRTVTMCGWHEPVLPGGDEIAGAGHLNVRAAAIAAGVLAIGAVFR